MKKSVKELEKDGVRERWGEMWRSLIWRKYGGGGAPACWLNFALLHNPSSPLAVSLLGGGGFCDASGVGWADPSNNVAFPQEEL